MAAVNSRTFSRILPESTGDRIGFIHTWDIEYKDKTGSFSVGDTVVDSISGLEGEVIRDTIDNTTSTSGVLSVRLLPGFESSTNTVDATLNVSASPQATVVTGYCVYVGRSVLVGGNNPTYGQSVDVQGQAFVRFAEGAPQFDGFGKMKVSQETTLGEYDFHYSSEADHFDDEIVGTGSISFASDASGILLSTGTPSGDKIIRTSNNYYTYQVGRSQLIEIACTVGDAGKTNVDRVWGYGDADNGIYFELSGTTFNALIRSSSSGSVIPTRIAQTAWSEDRLDGSANSKNVSGALLDLTKVNIFWMDFQLNGTIRFGVSINGDRVVCHIQHNTNSDALPFMRVGRLPLCIAQENTGTAGSTSELRVWSAAVKSEGAYEPKEHHFSGSRVSQTVTAANTALVTFRSKQTYRSLDNRVSAYGETIHIYSTTEPILVELVKNPTLGGSPTWAGDPGVGSSVEFDMAATTATGGTAIMSVIVAAGDSHDFDLTHTFSHDGEVMQRKADITLYDYYTIRATLLTGSTTDISTTADWHEVD